ncbi:MAG TPA: uroporphyrinogen-III synthase [Hyphomicrobium sp.]|nr:uroporphyrinogen-III synthase [Hyphomicrobium sp.]
MHVLLTRPERDAADLKARLEALGCRVSLAPLLEIKFHAISAAMLAGASALVATSRNGLQALAQSEACEAARALPVFAVGPGTTLLAQQLGFTAVIQGGGTAADLVPVIANHPAAQSGKLVQLAGDHLAFDMEAALAAKSIALTVIPAYASVAAETLPTSVIEDLDAGAIDCVVLMSPRSAATWVRLAGNLAVKRQFSTLTHICLSRAVADVLLELPGSATLIADKPNTDAIIAAVYRLAGPAKTG